MPLPCWYLVVLAEAILLWSMWQRLLQRCLTIRDVFLLPGEAPSGVVKSGTSITQERLTNAAL